MKWDRASLDRACRIIEEVVNERLQLTLPGRLVITEAATGAFAVTASIAAVAGARVEAIAADSRWGSAREASADTLRLAERCGVRDRVKIVDRAAANWGEGDIITNLGAIRPIDAWLVSRLKPGAVVPLMYDAREFRPGEIDLTLCSARQITVVGTNEDHPLVDVLRYSGLLAAKMLLEMDMEILRSHIVVLGDNLFAPHIVSDLHGRGACVSICRTWNEVLDHGGAPVDALVYIDYWNVAGSPTRVDFASWLKGHTGAALVQFVGGLDPSPFKDAGWRIAPDEPVPAQRMWRTLADLGVRPVIELHASGLKGAELELEKVAHNACGRLGGLRQQLPLVHTDANATSPVEVPR